MPATETASARYTAIEDWSTAELVEGLVESQFAAIGAVAAARAAIVTAAEAVADRLGNNGRLIYLGAGTSGRVGAQDAAELPPTFSWPYERAIVLMAGGPAALQRAVENAEDSREAAPEALRGLKLSKADVVIGIAASGTTPYVLAGIDFARMAGALTVGLLNSPDGPLATAAELAIVLDTGPEFLAGSTRLKAGTAQKVALNTLSTAVMVRLGYVHRGLMVEMRPTNEKLRQRAIRIVAALTGTTAAEAEKALAESGTIKTATVMLTLKLDRQAAEAKLAEAGGNLRRALA